MPSYSVEVATEAGTERHQFTLDDDRPLRPQVGQVLEELRQRGVVLKGAHDDELGVFWHGRTLDVAQSPAGLGISPAHPVELRMRARAAVAAAPVPRSLPKGILASASLGYVGGVAAWIAAGLAGDLTRLIPSYVRLDQFTMLLLGALTGAPVLAGAALRTRGSVLVNVGAGLVLGAAGAIAGASLALLLPGTSVRAFVIVRIVGWAVAAGLTAVLLAAFVARPAARRLAESFGLGLLAGAAAGVVFALPGPAELWHALAFSVFGAGVGAAVAGPLLWGAAAIVELVPPRGAPGIFSLREWPVQEGTVVDVQGTRVACRDGRVALYPAGVGTSVGGRTVSDPVYLADADRISIGSAEYDVRLGAAR